MGAFVYPCTPNRRKRVVDRATLALACYGPLGNCPLFRKRARIYPCPFGQTGRPLRRVGYPSSRAACPRRQGNGGATSRETFHWIASTVDQCDATGIPSSACFKIATISGPRPLQLSSIGDVCFWERYRTPADFRIDELIDILAERLAKRVETRLNDPSSTLRPRLLPVGQAAYYLGRTEDSMRHLIASGSPPASVLIAPPSNRPTTCR